MSDCPQADGANSSKAATMRLTYALACLWMVVLKGEEVLEDVETESVSIQWSIVAVDCRETGKGG